MDTSYQKILGENFCRWTKVFWVAHDIAVLWTNFCLNHATFKLRNALIYLQVKVTAFINMQVTWERIEDCLYMFTFIFLTNSLTNNLLYLQNMS